jgi:hypothetical protein
MVKLASIITPRHYNTQFNENPSFTNSSIDTVGLISYDESVIWRLTHDLFKVAETGGGII